jgi:hypothetical protein
VFVERWHDVLSRRTAFDPLNPRAVLATIELAAQPLEDLPPGPRWCNSVSVGGAENEIEWLRRERAMREVYAETLEQTADEMEQRLEELRMGAAATSGELVATAAELDQAVRELAACQDELERTRLHLHLIENRASYRTLNRLVAPLQRYQWLFGMVRKVTAKVGGRAGR